MEGMGLQTSKMSYLPSRWSKVSHLWFSARLKLSIQLFQLLNLFPYLERKYNPKPTKTKTKNASIDLRLQPIQIPIPTLGTPLSVLQPEEETDNKLPMFSFCIKSTLISVSINVFLPHLERKPKLSLRLLVLTTFNHFLPLRGKKVEFQILPS